MLCQEISEQNFEYILPGEEHEENIGGANLTTDGVDTIYSLFWNSYRDSKRCGRTI